MTMDPTPTGAPTTDRHGLVVLTPDDCWTLARQAAVGRIAFVHDGQPTMLPVNHRVVNHHVVFLSASGSKLGAATMEQPVAFEVDGWDPDARTGWSVVIEGTASVVDAAEELAELDALEFAPWAAGETKTDWVRITPLDISGRRLDR